MCNTTGEICAHKYEDVNLDGACNPGGGELLPDTPVPNWWICITTPAGDTFCQRTDVNGLVCWYNLPAGNYTVFEPAVAGWHPVGPNSYNVVVGATPVDVTFCNAQHQTSSEESSWGGIKSLFR